MKTQFFIAAHFETGLCLMLNLHEASKFIKKSKNTFCFLWYQSGWLTTV